MWDCFLISFPCKRIVFAWCYHLPYWYLLHPTCQHTLCFTKTVKKVEPDVVVMWWTASRLGPDKAALEQAAQRGCKISILGNTQHWATWANFQTEFNFEVGPALNRGMVQMNSRGPIQTGTFGFVFCFFPLALSLMTLGLKGRRGLQGWLQSPVPSHAGPCSFIKSRGLKCWLHQQGKHLDHGTCGTWALCTTVRTWSILMSCNCCWLSQAEERKIIGQGFALIFPSGA